MGNGFLRSNPNWGSKMQTLGQSLLGKMQQNYLSQVNFNGMMQQVCHYAIGPFTD